MRIDQEYYGIRNLLKALRIVVMIDLYSYGANFFLIRKRTSNFNQNCVSP